jgi:PAS domain S-box-containing protein
MNFEIPTRNKTFGDKPNSRRLAEAVISFPVVGLLDWLIFSLPSSSDAQQYALEYTAFLLVIWMALRFGLKGSALALLITASVATLNTFQGEGPFMVRSHPLTALRAFLVVLTGAGLIIGATIRKAKAIGQDSQERLCVSEERYRDLFENAQDLIVTLDRDGRFTSANNAVLEVSGYSREELLTKTIFDMASPNSLELMRSAFADILSGQKTRGSELELKCKDGRAVWIEVRSRRMQENGIITGIQSIGRDISWRRRLEEQLLHTQKMEAVGRLAGGVAHDFNNMLGVIIGYSDLVLDKLSVDDPSRRRIGQIRKAGARAAEVTRQLLAFSRKQILAPKILDLSSIVSETARMLLRLLGEDIELITKLSRMPIRVKADPAQMEQVIMNLAVNARDAMPSGGKLILQTSTAVLDETAHDQINIVPGRYALLTVTDTGTGMDEATRIRIFEPFFTTKRPGEGTGLGLATVYGFVKQSEGYIWAYSKPGHGTTFKIYLPAVAAPVTAVQPQQPATALPRGLETILLVEDEQSLRDLNEELLTSLGYTVLSAAHGAEALKMAQHEAHIHVLLTDVVMPGISGRELGEKLKIIRPELKVLYMSGYTDNVIIHHGILKPGVSFLQKPFTQETLASKVREVLSLSNGDSSESSLK